MKHPNTGPKEGLAGIEYTHTEVERNSSGGETVVITGNAAGKQLAAGVDMERARSIKPSRLHGKALTIMVGLLSLSKNTLGHRLMRERCLGDCRRWNGLYVVRI
jgi:hypothetical protein